MSECIAVLCNAFGCTDLEGLEAKLAVPGPCTASWKAGEFAGRCRTCQKTPHAAFCLPCLLEGNNHAGHDISVHVRYALLSTCGRRVVTESRLSLLRRP